MRIKIWGGRGSMPVSGRDHALYSGDTACIEVKTNSGDVILLDAGSGAAALSRAQGPDSAPPDAVFLSHLHLDHIQGLPFFPPLYNSDISIYGPENEGKPLASALEKIFDGVIFPVKWDSLRNVSTINAKSGSVFKVGGARVEAIQTSHTSPSLAYKITADGQTLVYTGDHESPLGGDDPERAAIHKRLLEFMADADAAVVDSHFSPEDHAAHPGWGHSDFPQWGPELEARGVKLIIHSHFSPEYTDGQISALLDESRRAAPGIAQTAASPGLEIDLSNPAAPEIPPECPVCDFFLRIAPLSDTHAILEAVLTESRRLTGADAGSIYLNDNNELSFASAQNDTLFPASAANKYAYINSRLPIDKSSIAGFTAATGGILNLPDVYSMPPDSPYGFNASFDKTTGYRTRSMLSAPFINNQGSIIGVLQLINAKDSEGNVVPFNKSSERLIARMAEMAAVPLEKSYLVISMIMRMLETSALRDPSETASHVKRVGSMAAELYHRWAESKMMDPEEIRAVKDRLRLAAMLHDIGKVGVPDGVLKKPGRLDDKERAIMQTHAALGAGLFEGDNNEIGKMAREIALHHHAKWNGTGYTGSDEIASPAEREIPLSARVVAIADVFDALVSRRCYKEPWGYEDAFNVLRKDAGVHFDPELVDRFIEIKDIIKNIYERYS